MTFSDLGLSPEILQALEQKGYGYPTTVQAEAIPPFLQWKDVIAKAPTGTGKTYAFGIPMIEHIDAESEDLQGLILAPTRELAIQICEELRSLLEFYKGIRVTVVYGGANIDTQLKQLQKHPQIVVATPGRLMVLDLFGIYLANVRGAVAPGDYDRLVAEAQAIPGKMDAVLADREKIQYDASQYFNHDSIFFIGRNLDYALGLEGSLKLKEISYIHSEAYASGELKHGTISLIEPGTLVVALGTYGPLFEKAMSSVSGLSDVP